MTGPEFMILCIVAGTAALLYWSGRTPPPPAAV